MPLRNHRVRLLTAMLAAASPARLRRLLLTVLMGHEIAPDAEIGRSIVLADKLVMRAGSALGSLNFIGRCERVELGEKARIGFLVWVSSGARFKDFFAEQQRRPRLVLGPGASVTCVHVIDCCDQVEIGAFTVMGGIGSQILSHSVDVPTGRQVASPVRIGERVFIGTGCIILSGAVVPSRTVLGAGAVVTGSLDDDLTLYAGVPATRRRSLDASAGFFTRTEGHVS